MSSSRPVGMRRAPTDTSVGENSPLDVDWLLPSKRTPSHTTDERAKVKSDEGSPPLPQLSQTEPTPPQSPLEPPPTPPATVESTEVAPSERPAPEPAPVSTAAPTAPLTPDPKPASAVPPTPPSQRQTPPARPTLGTRASSNDDNKSPLKGAVGNLKRDSGRRSSWISNLSSKFSSSTPSTPRSTSLDAQVPKVVSPQPSPKVEFGNPFNKAEPVKDNKKQTKKDDKERTVITSQHVAPVRRPSVLVAAGKETKLDNPGFLSSAFRRLSSSNNVTMGKGAGTGAIMPRKVMNIDQNRERIKIQEFDQNKLKRVAFCVDVEIAGFASQGDEEPDQAMRPPVSAGQRLSISAPSPAGVKDAKDAKYKEKGEGAALKNPNAATPEKEEDGQTRVDAVAQAAAEANAAPSSESTEKEAVTEPNSEAQPAPMTRKKEKKKRSEAERKERRERKRKHAEANGLVPLEITRDDDSSDSSRNSTPPGASTPRKSGDQPTTDPLRIYKRCCQLRETTVLSRVKEQISKPSATLAEAPGTVAVVDLSGVRMQLQDIVTLGDWLAVVPVRKLLMDDCGLTDEGVRVVLSGLSGCKSAEQVKQNRKLPSKLTGKKGQEQMGVVEKLSLKNNSDITNIGWKHIALFLHMSRSLKAIDLSGIPFPKGSGDLSRTTTASSAQGTGPTSAPPSKSGDLGALITRAIAERFGDKLEELILSRCGLSPTNVSDFVNCAIKCKIRRLGLAENNLDPDALSHVVRYVKSGVCEGLDLGGNNLHGTGRLVANAINDESPLFAISFADCSLDPADLSQILTPFSKLKNLKFMDLSRNPDLFSDSTNAVPVFRKLLPRLTTLKRIHLADVGMTSDHVIALAEIMPDCPALCHISILENEQLIRAMNSTDGASQEEACAFFASLMTAVRVSQTIIAIEIEIPSADSSEVVKALASQVVAYSLRNMEQSALDEVGVPSNGMPDKDAPGVLLHLVGHMDGYPENHDEDEPAPDEDYMIASTGIVKALGVCLGTKDGSRTQSRNISPSASGTVTPKEGALRTKGQRKPRDVSLELCESARKIRMRLRPALVKEDRAGNDANYRRLFFLDQTLQRMIQRFEDEYPETKVPPMPSTSPQQSDINVLGSSLADASVLSASQGSNGLAKVASAEEYLKAEEQNPSQVALRLSRTPSNTSLAAKAYTDEEGRMHRFGQSVRREVLKPTGMSDYAHGTSVDDPPESPHLAALRARLEELKGDEILHKVEKEGADNVVREMGMNLEELATLQKDDPATFEAFRKSQLAAQINSGVLDTNATQ